MYLLNLKDQRDIVKVIEYLVETHQKNNTVEDMMKRFGLSVEQYRMCCNLAVPALAQGNMKGRYTATRNLYRKLRGDVAALYEAVKDEEGPAAEGVRRLYQDWCVPKPSSVVFGKNEDDGDN